MACAILFSPFMGLTQRMIQPEVTVDFRQGKQDLTLGSAYIFQGDTVKCSALKLYLGGFSFLKSGEVVAQWPLDYFLVDVSDATSTSFLLPEVPSTEFDEVSFNIGVDSRLQADGPHGGALDPANGMYWTWQNGYIYAKVEGTISRNSEPAKAFAWHLGGYQGANNAVQRCTFPCNRHKVRLTMDWSELFGLIRESNDNHIMSPSLNAVRAMESIKTGVSVR